MYIYINEVQKGSSRGPADRECVALYKLESSQHLWPFTQGFNKPSGKGPVWVM